MRQAGTAHISSRELRHQTEYCGREIQGRLAEAEARRILAETEPPQYPFEDPYIRLRDARVIGASLWRRAYAESLAAFIALDIE